VNEYSSFNTTLFSELFEKNILTKRQMKEFKEAYLLQANIELKRQRAEEVEEADDSDGPNLRNSLYEQANDKLLEYASILLPFYEKDARVRALIDDMMQTGNPYIETRILVSMVGRGMPVSTEQLQARAEDVRTRFTLYRGLKKLDRLDLYPSEFLSLQSILDAKLWHEYLFENDSTDLTLIETLYIPARGIDAGQYAVYKGARKDYRNEKEHYLFISGPMEVLEDGTVDIQHARGRRLKRIDNEERMEEMIEDAIRDITYAGRKRYRKKGSDGYDFF
jgi:hypothetical protein